MCFCSAGLHEAGGCTVHARSHRAGKLLHCVRQLHHLRKNANIPLFQQRCWLPVQETTKSPQNNLSRNTHSWDTLLRRQLSAANHMRFYHQG